MRNKEPYNTSNEKAQGLKISDFGTTEEVQQMANMERFPKSFAEARKILSGFVGHPLISRNGLSATITKNSIEKILSDTGGSKPLTLKPHLLAAGNLDKLYSNAIEPWSFEMNPNRNNDGLTGVHRLFAPMSYEGNTAIVKITVKALKNPKDGNKIYTIKALDVHLE